MHLDICAHFRTVTWCFRYIIRFSFRSNCFFCRECVVFISFFFCYLPTATISLLFFLYFLAPNTPYQILFWAWSVWTVWRLIKCSAISKSHGWRVVSLSAKNSFCSWTLRVWLFGFKNSQTIYNIMVFANVQLWQISIVLYTRYTSMYSL